MKKIDISASLLAADFSQLGNELAKLDQHGIPYLHIDVMDGNYVPGISFGPPVVKGCQKLTKAALDVHLMVAEPEKQLPAFFELKPAIITVHQETVHYFFRLIDRIKKEGIKVGVSLNPATPVSTLKHILPLIDVVLLMTVDPGFYGQPYISGMTEKIRELDRMRKEQGLSLKIETDGGIDAETVKPLLEMIDMTVLGKAFFKNPQLEDFLKILGYRN